MVQLKKNTIHNNLYITVRRNFNPTSRLAKQIQIQDYSKIIELNNEKDLLETKYNELQNNYNELQNKYNELEQQYLIIKNDTGTEEIETISGIESHKTEK